MVHLPEALSGNRLGALCFLDTLNCEFEQWVNDATTDLAKLMMNTVGKDVDIDDTGVKVMMHQMIGAEVPKAPIKFCPLDHINDPPFILLNSVSYKEADVKENHEYISTWYPMVL